MEGNCLDRLSIQMYTVHEHAWNNLEDTMHRLAEMGYQGIEYYGHHSLFQAKDVAKMETHTGVKMLGWHTEWADLQEDTYEETVSYLESAGCPLVIVPCLGGEWNIGHTKEEECREIWLRYIDWLNELSEKLSARGIRLAYHNHDHEFLLRYEGKRVFDMLFENLNPDIMLEFDTGRAICAGVDCCEVLRQYGARDALIHLKPYSEMNRYESFLGDVEDCNNVREILRAYPGEFQWIMLESENRDIGELENAQKNAAYLCSVLADV